MIKNLLLIPILLFSIKSFAQQEFHLKDPGANSVLLNEGWKYSMHDYANAHLPDFNDSSWTSIRPAADIHDSMPEDAQQGIGFMRLKLRVDEHLRGKQLAFIVHQSMASEIYLNGTLIQAYGVVSNNAKEVKAYDPLWKPIPITLSDDSIQVIAVRFARQPGIRYTTIFGTTNPIFSIEILSFSKAIQVYKKELLDFPTLSLNKSIQKNQLQNIPARYYFGTAGK